MAKLGKKMKPKGGLIMWLAILVLGVVAISAFTGWNFGDLFGTGTGGTGTGNTPVIVQPTATNLWDARGSIDIKAPDVNLTIEDSKYSLTESTANPTGDSIYVYLFAQNPLGLTPNKTFYGDYDRLEYLVSEGRYLPGTSAITYTSANKEIIDTSILTNIAKSPDLYGITNGKVYILLRDNDYAEGTPGTNISGWPVVLEIDLRTIPAYRADASPGAHQVTFGTTMTGITQVFPADAGKASSLWNTRTGGWPELGTATVAVDQSGMNSSATNYQGAIITLGDGGIYFWQDAELAVRVNTNSSTQVLNKFMLGTEELKEVKTGQVGTTTYYFVKIPRDKAREGQVLKFYAYYESDETSTQVVYMPTIVKWNHINNGLSVTSAYARIADLDTSSITSSIGCD